MTNELTHWGIKGQKWGIRRFQTKDGSLTNAGRKRYADDDGSNNNSQKKVTIAKSRKNAKAAAKESIRNDKAHNKQIEDKRNAKKQAFKDARSDINKSRTTGAKVGTVLLAGPFANRTYASVLAAGGSRNQAIAATAAATMLGGPVGHLAVSAMITSGVVNDRLKR